MRPVRASPLRSSASRHSAPRACRPGRQPVLRDQHRGLTPTRRCLVMSQDVGCRCFGGMGLAPVPPAQPHRKSHDRQYVEEPRDRRPRQVDVAGVHCIEERSERRQQRPQDQRAAGLRERLCVDDAEAGEEEQTRFHPSRSRRGRARTGPQRRRCPARGRTRPSLDEPPEEDGLEDTHHQRHHQQRHPVHRRGQVVAPQSQREVDAGEQQREQSGHPPMARHAIEQVFDRVLR